MSWGLRALHCRRRSSPPTPPSRGIGWGRGHSLYHSMIDLADPLRGRRCRRVRRGGILNDLGWVKWCATSNDRRSSSATTTVLLTRSPKPSKCNLEPHEPSLSQRVVDKSQGTDVDVGLVVHEDCFGG